MRNAPEGSARSLLREPLLHFLVLGVALFLLFRITTGPDEIGEREIVVTVGQVDHIIEVFTKTRNRPPSPGELRGLVDDFVLEEVLYREGMAMGLDKDDTIIRRRLRQKMEFLVDDFVSTEPTDDDLRKFLSEEPERFRTASRTSFEHIVFRPGSGDRAERLLATLTDGGQVDIATAGDPVALPAALEAASESAIDAQFGPRFVLQLAELEPGVWSGPVESPYGRHVVRVTHRVAGSVPAFDDIRAQVKREWLASRRDAAQEALFDQLRSRYTITLETSDPVKPSGEQ